MKSKSGSIQMKATEQYFPVVLFIMLYKVVLTFESVDETLASPAGAFSLKAPAGETNETPKCDHSNKSYWVVLSSGAVYYAVQSGSNFWVCGWNPEVWPFNESYWAVLSYGAVCFLKFGKMRFAKFLFWEWSKNMQRVSNTGKRV